ncbi:MAG: hypothetical protein P1U39_06685 [Legionellaceae bacterium]|nr:hypothetical protein [Legionellaceae bacterium]
MPGENSTRDYALASLGAFGVAVQNYQAVESFLKSVLPLSYHGSYAMQATALGAGGVCSGMVNFNMNMGLLSDFSGRWEPANYDAYVNAGYFDYKKASSLDQAKYFGGSFIVIGTGVLFGLMAFTFAMGSPLAMVSLALGLFVTIITMIQELEAWLAAWDPKNGPTTGLPQSFGEWCGYIIAVGNVLAFSLMFTLSLAQTLILLHVAAVPALAIGAAVSFLFGGFTEYNFYAPYLTKLCGQFGEKWQAMIDSDWALAGLLCMSVNAFVNAALTYATLDLLTALMVSASIALPPVAVITALSVALTVFAGSASFLLGMNFWIGSASKEADELHTASTTRSLGIFCEAANGSGSEPDANADDASYGHSVS